MIQTLAPLASECSSQILCLHINLTSQIQIARIKNIPKYNFERIVFPGDRFLFEAVPEAKLEIYTAKTVSTIISEKISCDRLRVNEK